MWPKNNLDGSPNLISLAGCLVRCGEDANLSVFVFVFAMLTVCSVNLLQRWTLALDGFGGPCIENDPGLLALHRMRCCGWGHSDGFNIFHVFTMVFLHVHF